MPARPTPPPDTIPAAFAETVARFGARDALIDGHLRLSYEDLATAVNEVARALIASGIEPGDRISIWAPNIGEWVPVALAVYAIGAILVPINTRFKGPEAAFVLGKARVRMMFTVDSFLGTDFVGLLEDVAPLPGLAETVLLQGAREGATPWHEFARRAQSVDMGLVGARSRDIRPADVSDIIFTSGTTGTPKGAMLQHGSSLWVWRAWNAAVGLTQADRYLIVFPFFHTAGLKGAILGSVLAGSAMIPHQVFDVPSVMRRVADESITVLPGPPTVFQSILDHPDLARSDMSSLRLGVVGAATVPVTLIRRMRSELAFEVVVTGYGLTETVGIVTTCRPDDDPEVTANTSGRPLPGVEVAIVDENGNRLPSGEPGEVLTRGPHLMKGYFDNAEATTEALDSDGWLHTGDIGVVDDAGNLRITDRKKDMFIVGGFNAYPAEIERAIARHPGVSQIAVVGAPDARLGEVAVAFVVPRPGAEVDAEELIAWCRSEMANYKVPRHVEFVAALPLNATGKVLKYELREQARAIHPEAQALPEGAP